MRTDVSQVVVSHLCVLLSWVGCSTDLDFPASSCRYSSDCWARSSPLSPFMMLPIKSWMYVYAWCVVIGTTPRLRSAEYLYILPEGTFYLVSFVFCMFCLPVSEFVLLSFGVDVVTARGYMVIGRSILWYAIATFLRDSWELITDVAHLLFRRCQLEDN